MVNEETKTFAHHANQESLGSKTIKGLQWTYLGMGFSSVLQVGYTAVMARLLDPTAFGLVAMSGIVLRFGSYFAQMGMGSALIQKPEITDREIHSTFGFALVLGIGLFAITYLLAPLAIYLFDAPDVVPVIQVSALSFVLASFTSPATSLLRRALAFRELAIVETSSYMIGYAAIGLILAYAGYGVWSLVICSLSQNVLLSVASCILTRQHFALRFRWKDFKSLYSFGSRVSVVGFFEFIALHIDRVAIGRFYGAAPLGVYDRAYVGASLPISNLATTFSKVLLPAFSRIQTDPQRLRQAYGTVILLGGSFVLPTAFGIAGAANELVYVLLGDRWSEAIPILRILAIGAGFNFLTHYSGILCESIARLRTKLVIQAGHIVFLVGSFYSLQEMGILGIALGVALGEILRHVAYVFVVKEALGMEVAEIRRQYIPILFSGILIGCVIWLLSYVGELGTWSPVLTLIIQVCVGLVALIYFSCVNRYLPIRSQLSQRLKSSGLLTETDSFQGKLVKRAYNIFLSS